MVDGDDVVDTVVVFMSATATSPGTGPQSAHGAPTGHLFAMAVHSNEDHTRDASDRCKTCRVPTRFLPLAEVAEVLGVSGSQVYALVRSGELPAIKIGGRGQWRVESAELEKFIQRMYDETRSFVESHPFGRADEDGAD
jgi:excisionase family DNA binding protein